MEYTALYRRFRPMTFEEIVGQDHITKTLRNQVIADRVGHAYLFTGCRGCGKTSSAKVLARAVNCLNPKNGEPCNECSVCKAALDGSLTDIVEMDAASNNSVDDIRSIRDEVNFLPTIAKYRVYIIDEVHMLSTGAFNALLKTLEEPPKHVKFILATTEPQKLPATILSRCQRFDFKKIPNDDIALNLEKICQECKIEYTDDGIKLIAELSEGAMRDALSILERCAQDGENKFDAEKVKDLVGIPKMEYISNVVEMIINHNPEEALKITQQVIDDGKDINNLLWEMIKYIKDILMYIVTKEISNIYSEADKNKIIELSKKEEKENLLSIIYSLSKLENDLKWSSQKNIVFQVEILKLCSKENMNIEERVEKLENSMKNGNVYMHFETDAPTKGLSTNVASNVERNHQSTNSSVNKNINAKTNASTITQKANMQTLKGEEFWGNVIENLKEARMPMLYSNLMSTKAVLIDDLTVGIEFPNGLNSFGKGVIEKPENMQKLKELVSIECKKDMRIKLIDEKQPEISNNTHEELNLGININMIDE